jgi:hypothetical protein
MSSGGTEPHILNVHDSIYYMGVSFLLHEDCVLGGTLVHLDLNLEAHTQLR